MTVRLSHAPKTCSVAGCGGKHYARGVCNKHYQQLLRNGDVFDPSYKRFRARMRRIKLNDDGTATVKLTKGYEAIIDMVDVAKVYRHSWSAYVNPDGTAYAATRTRSKGAETIVLLHRLVLGLPDGVLADHKNGQTLDCRKSNLRPASNADNSHNVRWRGSSSGFKGVTQKKPNGRFQAQIQHLGATHWLGTFDTPEEAARAYDAKARELHGEFACVNFPIGNERPARPEEKHA